jgi:hypothetical protein
MELLPQAGLLPLLHPVPQRHPRAAHLPGKVLPGDACLEYKQGPGQTNTIGFARLVPLELGFHGGRIGSTGAQNSSSTGTHDTASSLMQRVASCDLEYVGIEGHDL